MSFTPFYTVAFRSNLTSVQFLFRTGTRKFAGLARTIVTVKLLYSGDEAARTVLAAPRNKVRIGRNLIVTIVRKDCSKFVHTIRYRISEYL